MTNRDISEVSVYPQDWGVTDSPVAGGDPNSAAEFASLVHSVGIDDTVVSGCDLTVQRNGGQPYLIVTGGKAVVTTPSATVRLIDNSADGYSDEVLDEGAAFSAEFSGEANIGLADNEDVDIYLDIDLSVNDKGTIRTSTSGLPSDLSGDAYLKIGVADTTNDRAFPTNRYPDLDRGMATDLAHSVKTHIPRGERKHVANDEHMQLTLPRDVEYTIDGELTFDGTGVILHV